MELNYLIWHSNTSLVGFGHFSAFSTLSIAKKKGCHVLNHFKFFSEVVTHDKIVLHRGKGCLVSDRGIAAVPVLWVLGGFGFSETKLPFLSKFCSFDKFWSFDNILLIGRSSARWSEFC